MAAAVVVAVAAVVVVVAVAVAVAVAVFKFTSALSIARFSGAGGLEVMSTPGVLRATLRTVLLASTALCVRDSIRCPYPIPGLIACIISGGAGARLRQRRPLEQQLRKVQRLRT